LKFIARNWGFTEVKKNRDVNSNISTGIFSLEGLSNLKPSKDKLIARQATFVVKPGCSEMIFRWYYRYYCGVGLTHNLHDEHVCK
jgi:hypothetical protein